MQEKGKRHYLDTLIPYQEKWIIQLEEEAKNNHVPIMDRQGIQLLQQIIRLHKPKRILEIGTAIGYSALRMQEASKETKIVSVERDSDMYQQAQRNIEKQNKEDKIELLFGDALDIREEIIAKGPYDFIFIDAAKGQYQSFFQIFSRTLPIQGCVVTDNVLFKGYVVDPKDAPKRLQKLAAKIHQYNEWLMNHSEFHTSIFSVGDGVALSIKKE